jgi:hypothetical protein
MLVNALWGRVARVRFWRRGVSRHPEGLMKTAITIASCASFAVDLTASAAAQEPKDVICAQGTYSVRCPKVVWCPAKKCGIAIPRADGDIDIIYSSEPKMDGTHRRPLSAGRPMSLQHLAGKVIVFEWDDSGDGQNPGSDLPIKDILYVIMPPPQAG